VEGFLNTFLMVHEFALILTVLVGIMMLFKDSSIMKKIHYTSGIVLVVTIFVYLFQTSITNIRYLLYGLLLLLAFFSLKIFKANRRIIIHVGIVLLSIIWLVLVHII